MSTDTPDPMVLLLRLAGPLQSWGGASEFNRRDTRPQPTKSGVLGLLAAAQGRRRDEPIADLLGLDMGVRVDQPGSVLRDYHTVSDYRGVPLLSAAVSAKGAQKPTSPVKRTHVTHRFYLQDAVFTVAIAGPTAFLDVLADALSHPAFPLALGRRSCVPTGPLLIDRRVGTVEDALRQLPWQASTHIRDAFARSQRSSTVDLPLTIDDAHGEDTLTDVPTSFDPRARAFTHRRVRHGWATVPSGVQDPDEGTGAHDPFALLGW